MIPRHLQITISLLLMGVLVCGIYIIKLTNKEEAKTLLLGAQDRPMAAPVSGRRENIDILVAYDEDHALRWRQTTVFMPDDPGLRAREALRAVLAQYLQTPSPHPLPAGSDIKEVYLVNGETAVIDTTAPFGEKHPSGVLVEEMTLTSLVETLTANVPEIRRVKFLVDGKERETLAGHADLMSFYESSAVHDLAQEFE